MAVMTSPSLAAAPPKTGYYRWLICAMLLMSATINYVDRQVIGILKPTLVAEFGWADERIYAAIVFSFQLAYAIGMVLGGRIIDRIGLRLGFTLAVIIWSLAAVGHAFADRLAGFTLPALIIDASIGVSVVASISKWSPPPPRCRPSPPLSRRMLRSITRSGACCSKTSIGVLPRFEGNESTE